MSDPGDLYGIRGFKARVAVKDLWSSFLKSSQINAELGFPMSARHFTRGQMPGQSKQRRLLR
jgi:hypothetical protein